MPSGSESLTAPLPEVGAIEKDLSFEDLSKIKEEIRLPTPPKREESISDTFSIADRAEGILLSDRSQQRAEDILSDIRQLEEEMEIPGNIRNKGFSQQTLANRIKKRNGLLQEAVPFIYEEKTRRDNTEKVAKKEVKIGSRTKEVIEKVRDLSSNQISAFAELSVQVYKKDARDANQEAISDFNLPDVDSNITRAVKALEEVHPNNEVSGAYRDFINKTYENHENATAAFDNAYYRPSIRNYWNFLEQVPGDKESAEELKKKIASEKLLRGGWGQDGVRYSEEVSRYVYDLSKDLLKETIMRGGRESGAGSVALAVMRELRDPRAVEDLIDYLKLYPGGHSSAIGADALVCIAEDPNSVKELEEVKKSLSAVDKEVVNLVGDRSSRFRQWSFDNYVLSYGVSKAHMTVAKEKLTALAESLDEEELTEDDLRTFYHRLEHPEGDTSVAKVLGVLSRNKEKVADIITDSRLPTWLDGNISVARSLVHNKDDFSYFPIHLATRGIGGSESAVEKLKHLYSFKDLSEGARNRETYVKGLLLLNSREDGKEIFDTLLEMTTASKDGSRRLRKVFSRISQLESMGALSFPQDTKSLSEVEQRLIADLITSVSERLGLSEDVNEDLEARLDELLSSNMLEVFVRLTTRVKEKGGEDNIQLITNIVTKYIRDELNDWKYSHRFADEQLELLNEKQRSAWISDLEKTSIRIESTNFTEQIDGFVTAINNVFNEARAHVIDGDGTFNFDVERELALEIELGGVVNALKSPETPAAAKRELGLRKRELSAEGRVISIFNRIKNTAPQELEIDKLRSDVSIAQSVLMILGFEQSKNDLDQIEKILATYSGLEDVNTLTVEETGDPDKLFKSGTEPRETCQSWRDGVYSHCLPSTVANAHMRLINVYEDNRGVVGRALIKMKTYSYDTEDTQKPAIFLEPTYTNLEAAEVYDGILSKALEKANVCGADLLVSNVRDLEDVSGASNEGYYKTLIETARRLGYSWKDSEVYVTSPMSIGGLEYSDSLGGELQYYNFNSPRATRAIVFEKQVK